MALYTGNFFTNIIPVTTDDCTQYGYDYKCQTGHIPSVKVMNETPKADHKTKG